MRKRLWDLAKSRIEIGTILPGHRHKVKALSRFAERGAGWRTPSPTSALDFSLRTKTGTRTQAAVVYPS